MMKYGVRLGTRTPREIDEAVGLAVAAEEAGWDGVFVSDSIMFGFSDPWSVLGAIAARTERVLLGTWITPVPQLQPWRLAHAVAALDRLSNGRVIFGTGMGVEAEHELYGDGYERGKIGRKYDEALEIITRLWTGQEVSFEGEFFTLGGLTLPILPVQQPRVPIVTAAWWPNRKAFRRATRWDGIMPYWPALLGDDTGPEGQQPTGASPEEELEELLEHYHGLTDEPGEIIIPRQEREQPGLDEVAERLGVTWQLTYYDMDEAEIKQGPPR
jgi:alkanesulfonate monooxygenase SsuD/methylene tetrahydromethanopterin reductase-like flavin-dependent oxidoreductase (luciferase family)